MNYINTYHALEMIIANYVQAGTADNGGSPNSKVTDGEVKSVKGGIATMLAEEKLAVVATSHQGVGATPMTSTSRRKLSAESRGESFGSTFSAGSESNCASLNDVSGSKPVEIFTAAGKDANIHQVRNYCSFSRSLKCYLHRLFFFIHGVHIVND